MSEASPAGKPAPGRRFLGMVALGIGALMAAFGALCLVYFLSAGIADGEDSRYTIVVIIVGSVPIILGTILLLIGRHLRRRAR